MSDYGFFWNSRGGDRLYNADSMEEWLKPFFVTGVFNDQLQVTATSGMGISVAAGYVNIDGKVKPFTSDTAFTLDIASGVSSRVDTVVVERNNAERQISLKVVKGDSSGQPTAPVRDDGIYQLVLAQITVEAGVTSITQSDIRDTRTDSELCGYVVSTVDEIDFDQINIQFTTWFEEYKQEIIHDFDDAGEMAKQIFNEWFQHMKGQLDSDAAGHLQNEIDEWSKMIEDAYSNVSTYEVGDYATYETSLYRCNTAITEPENFDSNKWDKVQVLPTIDTKLSEMEEKLPREIEATLFTNLWVNKTQEVTVTGLTSTDTAIIGLDEPCFDEERAAAVQAAIKPTLQEDNKITVVCEGVVPKIDIPILITIV